MTMTDRHRFPDHLKKPERLGVKLPAGSNRMLDELAVRNNTSKSEIVRRGIDLVAQGAGVSLHPEPEVVA